MLLVLSRSFYDLEVRFVSVFRLTLNGHMISAYEKP